MQPSQASVPAVVPDPAEAAGQVVEYSLDIDYEADAGDGAHDLGRDDIQIPLLVILQANSPFAKRSDPKYITDAAEGMIMNSVTHDLYSGDRETGGVLVIPCAYERKHVEWVPRDAGGGFVMAHPITEGIIRQCTRNENNRDALPNGNEIIDTAYHFVLLLDPADPTNFTPIVIPMARTQLKVSRRWNTLIKDTRLTLPNRKKIQPPWYATRWRLFTVGETNDQYSWCNWGVEFDGIVTDKVLYEAGKAFREEVLSGRAKPIEADGEWMDGQAAGDDVFDGGAASGGQPGGGQEMAGAAAGAEADAAEPGMCPF